MSQKSKAWRSAVSALRKLWNSFPKLECQGKCYQSCGPIFMSDLEGEILERKLGHPLPPMGTEDNPLTCPLLKNYRCSVYEDRPTICRLWGMVNHSLMSCPFGCRPSRRLTDQEARFIIQKVQEISDRYEQVARSGPNPRVETECNGGRVSGDMRDL